jgi:hypothetical protein
MNEVSSNHVVIRLQFGFSQWHSINESSANHIATQLSFGFSQWHPMNEIISESYCN